MLELANLKVRVNVLQVDIANLNAFSDEVIVHFNMLRARVEHWVPSKINFAHVVTVKENWILDGNAQILQASFYPHGFTCGDCRAPVFGFCAQQCDCQLLLVAPVYGATAEGEDES